MKNIIEDILIDYGGQDEKGTYTSGQFDLLVHRLSSEIKVPAENYICCEELNKALGDHNGLHSQTIGSISSDKIDSIIMYKGGDYKIRNRIIVQYCPFCGKPRRRASEYKKETA